MSNNNETNAFVKNVHLKGFKSIKDLEVRLNNGLNIIIGPNGSGKTNFVEAIDFALRTSLSQRTATSYTYELIIGTGLSEIIIKEECVYFSGFYKGLSSDYTNPDKYSSEVIDSKKKSFKNDFPLSILIRESKVISNIFTLFKPTFIPFSIEGIISPFMLSEQGQISISKESLDFLKYDIIIDLFEKSAFNNYSFDGLSKKIEDYLILKKDLIQNLNQYTPIKDLRLSGSMNIIKTETHIDVNYLMLEFYVNNRWCTWKELSDGTKRIFYIILNVLNDKDLVLIEEPENGVHPDQLFLLLDFFKEQSKHKQIIITTHSPEVLNILEKDELDRIIVTRYEEGRGTQMHHLSEKKIKKAKAYMSAEGLALKDFWVHSNLEEFDEKD